jgi:Putative prokaryotic signal transducing protein
MWRCPICRKEVDDSFEVCWACGTTHDGIEDPTFVTADKANRIADQGVEKEPKFIDSLGDFAGILIPDLVECYTANNVLEAAFIANQLKEQGIKAIADSRDANLSAGLWNPEYGPKVRVRPEDLDRVEMWLKVYEQRCRSRQDELD